MAVGTMIIILFTIFACAAPFLKKTYSRRSLILNAAKIRECRTWIGLRRKKETEKLSKTENIDSYLITNKQFELHEIVDSGSFSTSIILKDNGDIKICSTNGPDCVATGFWSLHSDILRMIINRTYQGKYTQYSIKSHYLGTLESKQGENDVIIEGDICDEVCDPDRDVSVGKFLLFSYTQTALSAGSGSTVNTSTKQKSISA